MIFSSAIASVSCRRFFPMLRIAVYCVIALISTITSAQAAEYAHGLSGKLITGYQGWFGCPDDFESNRHWQHWFVKSPQAANLTVDMLPAVGEISASDLCDTGLRRPDGSAVRFFSSQNERVVATHFHWMQKHGIDGAAVQRFVSELDVGTKRNRGDHVLRNVRSAAEGSDRIFHVTYDISGANPKTVTNDIRHDWRHLVEGLGITGSPNYLRDQGKPVLQLWGFGFRDRPGAPEEVAALIRDLTEGRDGLQAVTLVGGVPAGWRTLSGDSKSDPAWARIYRSYQVISPWVVGRFSTDQGADDFFANTVLADIEEARLLGIAYQPVIFPGFSWHNMMRNRGRNDLALFNQIKRDCGKFLWRQVANLLGAHVESLYAAMFDEVDEGTALFPLEARADRLPVGAAMLTLNQDACSLPDDWYLRITGKAAEHLRHRSVPSKQLDAVLKP